MAAGSNPGYSKVTQELAVGELRLVRGWDLLTPDDLAGSGRAGTNLSEIWSAGRVMLKSHYVNWVWEPGTNKAFHYNGSHAADAPAELCACGLYGVFAYQYIPVSGIVGVVEYWGKVRMGALGIRAQYARIVGLAPGRMADFHYTRWRQRDERRRLDSIAERYESSVHYSQRELIEAYRTKLSTPEEFGIQGNPYGDYG